MLFDRGTASREGILVDLTHRQAVMTAGWKECRETLVLICLGVSRTKMALESRLALIFPLSPCSAGKKRDSISAGF